MKNSAYSIWVGIFPKLSFAFVLICSGITCFCGSSFAGGALYVRYSLPKSAYLTAESIVLTAQFENHGNEAARFEFDDLWRLILVDGTDQMLPRKSGVGTITYLHQFDEQGNRIDHRPSLEQNGISSPRGRCVNDDFGIGPGIHDFYLPPGSYRLWNSLYASDTISFTVTDPVDQIERSAMTTLIDALDHRYERLNSPTKRYIFYREFLQKYPSGPYSLRALRKLFSLYPIETPGLTDSLHQEYVRRMILQFPESGLTYEAIPRLKAEFTPIQERDSVLQVIRRYVDGLPTEEQRVIIRQTIQVLEK